MDIRDKVVRAWKTVREMLSDRGITEHRQLLVGDEEVRGLTEQKTTFSVVIKPDLCVVFHTSPVTIKKTDLFSAIDKCSHAIVVFHTKPQGPTIRSLVSQGHEQDITLEFFDLTHLQYNISRHVYVPKHDKISPEETSELLKRYYLKSRFQLPLILDSDPMARYLGLKHGEVVKITRASQTTGSTVFYRCCKS